MEEDISFDFDAKSLLNPIKMVTKGWKKMVSVIASTPKTAGPAMGKISKQAGGMGKGVGKVAGGMKMGFGKLLGVLALLSLAFFALKSAILSLPEVGRTFAIAGNIFKRNLLAPLRKELLPLLNKLLAWVRDNRKAFVAWGEHIATVFRIAFQLGKMFFKAIGTIFKAIGESISAFFGSTTQSLMDTLRVILTKITFVILFVMILLEPVFELIGKIIGFLIVGVANLVGWFIKGFLDIAEALDLSTDFKNMIKAFDEFIDAAAPLLDVLKFVGYVIGVIIGVAIKIIIKMITIWAKILTALYKFIIKLVKAIIKWAKESKTVKAVIDGIRSALSWLIDKVSSAVDGISKFIDSMKEWSEDATKSMIKKWKEWGDAIEGFIGGVIKKVKELIGWFTNLFKSEKKLKKLEAKVPTPAEIKAAKRKGGGATTGGTAKSVTVNNNNNQRITINPTTEAAGKGAVETAVDITSGDKSARVREADGDQ